MRPLIGSLPPMVKALPKMADSIYLSREWRALLAEIKRERGSWCEACGAAGRIIGDHVVELKDGGAPLDKRNVRLRCIPCHARKTADARRKRAMGNPTGG